MREIIRFLCPTDFTSQSCQHYRTCTSAEKGFSQWAEQSQTMQSTYIFLSAVLLFVWECIYSVLGWVIKQMCIFTFVCCITEKSSYKFKNYFIFMAISQLFTVRIHKMIEDLLLYLVCTLWRALYFTKREEI